MDGGRGELRWVAHPGIKHITIAGGNASRPGTVPERLRLPTVAQHTATLTVRSMRRVTFALTLLSSGTGTITSTEEARSGPSWEQPTVALASRCDEGKS